MVKVLIREEWDPENWKRGMWEDLEDEDIEFLNSDESSLPIEGASPPQDKYMLSTRDPPQNKEHIQTESEGLEKDISCKWRPKESRSSNTHIR